MAGFLGTGQLVGPGYFAISLFSLAAIPPLAIYAIGVFGYWVHLIGHYQISVANVLTIHCCPSEVTLGPLSPFLLRAASAAARSFLPQCL